MKWHILQDMREHPSDLWEELLTERHYCLQANAEAAC
jgi:hypothetical protein